MLDWRAGAGSDRLKSMHLVLLASKSSWRHDWEYDWEDMHLLVKKKGKGMDQFLM
jgi:hypothetical protein